jgi:hypothetical protein
MALFHTLTFFRGSDVRSETLKEAAVGIATGYGFDSRQCKIFLFSTESIPPLGAHPASYPMGTASFFPGGKVTGGVKLTTHLHVVPRPRKVELYLHTPYVFMVLFLTN